MALAACKPVAHVTSSSSPRPTAATPQLAPVLGAPQGRLSMRHNPLKNVGRVAAAAVSLQLVPELRGTPLHINVAGEHKANYCWSASTERWPGAATVRALTNGEFREVKKAAKELYYNVVVRVPSRSEVAKWYTTPGKYVYLIPKKTNQDDPAAFFIASPVIARRKGIEYVDLEFLIEDVPNTVANELINSQPGDGVCITTDAWSSGFDMSQLNSIEDSVLMFASGYGLGPFRALIETGFQANQRKNAILFTMYSPDQQPYTNLYPKWEETGVKVVRLGALSECPKIDPDSTIVLMVASKTQQESIAKHFEAKGVPAGNIQTLFDGIPDTDRAYYNKVLHNLKHYPKFPHCGEKHVPIELKA